MDEYNMRAQLWANVEALMVKHYGDERLTRFATDIGVGPATLTRIKAQDTSIGLDVIERIAATFTLAPWQVLAPRLGAGLYSLEQDGDTQKLVPAVASVRVEAKARDARLPPRHVTTDTPERVVASPKVGAHTSGARISDNKAGPTRSNPVRISDQTARTAPRVASKPIKGRQG